MQHIRTWIAAGLLLAAPVLLAQDPAQNQAPPSQAPQAGVPPAVPDATSASPTTAQPKTHKIQKELVLPPLPSGPLPQLPMDQIPATPAKVNLQNGLLSISAENSTLGEILRDVRKLTGAAIDIPPGSGANERVVAHLGPGAPRDVLAVLLNGSSFNYVMIGSSADPAEDQAQPVPAQPAPTDATANAAANANATNAQDQQQPDPNQPNAGPRTPEQVLEMLRRQQPPGAVTPPQPPPQQ
jgi:hypothetical protein